jgi:uncharacterized membrane protein
LEHSRRHEPTRLEAFSDAVFAFALTLLVVALDVPKNYADLMNMIGGFLPFAACFALLVWMWCLLSAGVGGLALLYAPVAPLAIVFVSPMLFALMGPAHGFYGRRASRQRARLESRIPDP